jgi:spore maturation protein CgeB
MVREYLSRGARRCIRVFPALDADVTFEVLPDARFVADAGFMGNRLYDRDERVERFFFDPARVLPTHRFILAGSGWSDGVLPDNVVSSGHVRSTDHNAFNSSPRVVLSIGREQAVARGFALSSRIMEAAGSAACIITDAWEGISTFFEPGREILVAHDGDEVLALLRWLTSGRARAIGQAARLRARAEHTYAQRATQVEAVLDAGAARQSISYC